MATRNSANSAEIKSYLDHAIKNLVTKAILILLKALLKSSAPIKNLTKTEVISRTV